MKVKEQPGKPKVKVTETRGTPTPTPTSKKNKECDQASDPLPSAPPWTENEPVEHTGSTIQSMSPGGGTGLD